MTLYQLTVRFTNIIDDIVDHIGYPKVYSTEELAWKHEEDFKKWLKYQFHAKANTILIFCDTVELEE